MKITDAAEILKDAKRKVVLIHGNADMDALGSAYAIRSAFPDADIFAPAGLDRVTKMVAEKLDAPIIDHADLSSYGLTVVVDTSSPEQLQNDDVHVPEHSLVIDHHAVTGKWEGMDLLCDDTRTSCCEIIKDIIDAAGVPLSRDAGLALLGGILTDSGHFQYADPRALRTFADILDTCGIPMDEALMLTRAPLNMSERVAAMKAAGRSKFERVGDMIVAVSFGSSFEAASCRSLMAAGADVAFVGSQRDNEFRVSARASQEMVRRGVKLDQIMGQVCNETFTDGGGHGGAAGMTGVGDAEAMVHMCMMRTMEEFRKIKASMEAANIPFRNDPPKPIQNN